MKHLGRGFFVLVDRDGNEVSERAPGEAWLAFEHPSRLTLVIHPDSTDRYGMVPLTPAAPGAVYIAMGLDEQGVILTQLEQRFDIPPGGVCSVNWNPMLDAMS
jgi:hypothetical protein